MQTRFKLRELSQPIARHSRWRGWDCSVGAQTKSAVGICRASIPYVWPLLPCNTPPQRWQGLGFPDLGHVVIHAGSMPAA